jgi:hypothetical protein
MLVILGLASVVAASALPYNSTTSQPNADFFNLLFNLLPSNNQVAGPMNNEIPTLKNSGIQAYNNNQNSGIPAYNNNQNSGIPSYNNYQNSGIPAFNNNQISGTPSFNNYQNSGIPTYNNYQYSPGNNYNYNSNLPNMQSMMTCISSRGGGSALQTSTKILRSIIPIVTEAVEKIKIIASQSEPSLVLKGIADFIRGLEPLGDKPELQDLKECWTELSPESQNSQAPRGLENFCNGDNKINMDSIAPIMEQLEQIAVLIGSFDARAGEKMGNWINFGTQVAARIQNVLENSDCSNLGSLSTVADIFDDVASLGGSLDISLDSPAGTSYRNNY